jgi:exosome complex RNA-binding protein Rrp4
MSIVAPGDVVCQIPESGTLKFDQSIIASGSELVCIRPGRLQSDGLHYTVAHGRKLYSPVLQERVIGIVTGMGHNESCCT